MSQGDTYDTASDAPGAAPRASRYVAVALVQDVPAGGLRRVEVEGRLLLLASVAGQIYATDDDCTHISGPLDRGELDGCVLTCPVHLAQFDVRDGRVLRGPAREPLPTYPIRIEGDQVLVGLPGDSGA
ncbi:MAG TPA: non-heme iron oxygenase ferredoxin subunit [Ktedonobacterales bacterium]